MISLVLSMSLLPLRQRNIFQDVYVLECEYMTRKDARSKRREKSAKLDYEALEQIRQEHHIPDIDEQLKVQVEQVHF